jgi:hypothetical protein
MNDFDDSPLDEVIATLSKMKRWAKARHGIEFNDITVMGGDADNSYRCVSFTELTFNQLVECVAICEHIDIVWLRWIIVRGVATIRMSNKVNRYEDVKVVHTIRGKSSELPEMVVEVSYRTMVR